MLDLVGLTDKAATQAEKLSGGQAQRLSIACALVHDPDLVFLDEPTAALDPQARRNLWDVLRAINERGRTVVLTTHYMDEAETLCDRVAIMDDGKILQLGPPAELVRDLDAPVRISVEAGAMTSELGGRDRRRRRRSIATASRRSSPPAAGAGAGGPRRGGRAGRPAGPRRHPGGRVPQPHRPGVPGMSASAGTRRVVESLASAMFKGFYRDWLSVVLLHLLPAVLHHHLRHHLRRRRTASADGDPGRAGACHRPVAAGGEGRVGRGRRTVQARPWTRPWRRCARATSAAPSSSRATRWCCTTRPPTRSARHGAGHLRRVCRPGQHRASGVPPTLHPETAAGRGRVAQAIQFVAPGMIGYGIAVGAIFGAAMTLITWREKKLLRRLRLAPVSTATVVTLPGRRSRWRWRWSSW